VVDSHVQNEGNGWAGSGANPWHLDADTESYAFLANLGDKPARIGFKVWANGQIYYLDSLQLVPHETRMIDLRKLRDAQEADFKKDTIAAEATDGSVLWLGLDNVPVMGRLAVVTRHCGLASSYDCCTCQCAAQYSGTEIEPVTACPIAVTNTDQETAEMYMAPPCGGSGYYYDITSQVSWGSSNTGIFTVSNSGLLTGVGGGSALANANDGPYECGNWAGNGGYCNCTYYTNASGSGPCSVQTPTSLKVLKHPTISMTYIGSPCDDTSSYYGIDIAVLYQVLDQNGQPMNNSNMEPQEEVLNVVDNGQSEDNTTPNWADVGPTEYPGTSQFTNSSGQFYDAPFGTCSTAPVVFTQTQKIGILLSGAVFPVRTKNWTTSSSSGGHGSINNGTGGDISNTR